MNTTIKPYPVLGSSEPKGSNRKFEFFKLDRIDVQVASWVYRKHPKALYSYLEFIAPEYGKNGVELNIQLLYSELLIAQG